ncbi:MAG: anaerobic sulfatase maturase [Anaerolineaceae bacterium]|nr:anaerobic sulfatase maturase [Anaerolineaceae bacterium]
MVKPRGSICNLACEYCYFLSKEQLYPGSDFRMSDELLEDFTRQYLQSQRVPQVTFSWQGGEPTLMGIPFFEKALAYQRKYAPAGMRVENTFQTNGTLLDEPWGAFLKENNFLVGVSLDGPPELHNLYRKDKGGQGSAEKALAGLEILKRHQVDFNILCTVHAGNENAPLEVYRYFRDDLKIDFIQFIPIVERMNTTGYQTGNKVTERSVSGRGYGDFLITIFDEWVQRDVGSVFVQIFDVSLARWVGAQGDLCVFEETCGLGLALEHNGDLYSCDHFVEPKHKLGNISKTPMLNLVESHQQYQFGMEKVNTLPKYCLACDVRFACNGGCPKNRIRNTKDGEYGLNYLCEGYQAFFTHIDQPMRQMADLLRSRRPAADIMKNINS